MFAVEKTTWACSYCRYLTRLNSIPSVQIDNIHKRNVRFKVTTAVKNHYDILGIDRHATQAKIKEQFIKLSKENHPDVSKVKAGSHERFVRINEAYKVLSKPSSRSQYDATLQYGNLHRHHAYAGTYRPRPRSTQRDSKYPPRSDYEYNPGNEEWQRYYMRMNQMNQQRNREEVGLFWMMGAIMSMLFAGASLSITSYNVTSRRTAMLMAEEDRRLRAVLQEEQFRNAEMQDLSRESQLEYFRKRMIAEQYRRKRRYQSEIPEETNKSE